MSALTLAPEARGLVAQILSYDTDDTGATIAVAVLDTGDVVDVATYDLFVAA